MDGNAEIKRNNNNIRASTGSNPAGQRRVWDKGKGDWTWI
jgi:hypothetical protein